MIKKFFKKIFCKHNYVYVKSYQKTFHEADFSGDGCYNTWTERYDIYKCTKCNKTKHILK